jgi:hypothetical protein
MIRPALPADAETIARVHVGTWQAAYREVFPSAELANLSVERRVQLWETFLPRDDLGIFVSEADGSVHSRSADGRGALPQGVLGGADPA